MLQPGIRNRSSGCGHRPAPSDAAALRPALADRDAGRNRARPAVLGGRLAVHALARPPCRLLAIPAHPQLQLLVRLGALHAHHRLALAAFPLRATRPLASPAGAPPVGRALLLRAHRGHERRAAVARHDRRKAVRVVARRPAIGAPELRLGDDHLLGDRRPEPRRPLLSRVARSRAAHVTTRDEAGRGAAGRASAAAPPALPVQHAARDLRAHAQGRRGRGSHADATSAICCG